MSKIFRKILTILGGVVTGFLNGFFGGGGGMLCVPLLEKIEKLECKKSHATAILVILPISVASAISYAYNGYFDFGVALPVSGGVLVGGVIGALLLKILPEKVVGLVFACLMVVAGVKMLF